MVQPSKTWVNQVHILDSTMSYTPIQVGLPKSQGFKDKFESTNQGKIQVHTPAMIQIQFWSEKRAFGPKKHE